LVVFLIFITWALAEDPCTQNGIACAGCVSDTDQSCGWCSATQTCMQGNISGPAVGYCIKAWEFGTCSDCQKMRDCRACREYPSCCWTPVGTGSCHPNGFIGCKFTPCACEAYASCDTCTAGTGCNWCSGDSKCVAEGSTNCSNTPVKNCLCANNMDCYACRNALECVWCDNYGCANMPAPGDCLISHSCTAYCQSQASNCDACNAVLGCGWCSGSNRCVDVNTAGQCPGLIAHTCPISCLSYRSCESCVGNTACGWCPANGNCYDPNDSFKPLACNALQHICTTCSPKTGFDAGSFVGGMFLIIGLVIIGGIGFLYYKRRQAHLNYTQVN